MAKCINYVCIYYYIYNIFLLEGDSVDPVDDLSIVKHCNHVTDQQHLNIFLFQLLCVFFFSYHLTSASCVYCEMWLLSAVKIHIPVIVLSFICSSTITCFNLCFRGCSVYYIAMIFELSSTKSVVASTISLNI